MSNLRQHEDSTNSRWLVTGAVGQLGGHVIDVLRTTSCIDNILAVNRRQVARNSGTEFVVVDLRDTNLLQRCVVEFQPTHIIHLGGMTSVGEAQRDPDTATRVNVDATNVLAEVAADLGSRFVFASTDMVFDGNSAPHREDAVARPLSHYGRTKAEAEAAILGHDRVTVVRLPLLYGFPHVPRTTTFTEQIAALRERQSLQLFTDEYRTPIWLADAAKAVVALAQSDFTGIIHVAGPERLSRFEMVSRFADLLGIREPQLIETSRLSIDSSEPRPADLSLDGSMFMAKFPQEIPGPIRAEVFECEPRH